MGRTSPFVILSLKQCLKPFGYHALWTGNINSTFQPSLTRVHVVVSCFHHRLKQYRPLKAFERWMKKRLSQQPWNLDHVWQIRSLRSIDFSCPNQRNFDELGSVEKTREKNDELTPMTSSKPPMTSLKPPMTSSKPPLLLLHDLDQDAGETRVSEEK